MRLLLLLAALLWAAPAFGQASATWNSQCDGAGSTKSSVGANAFACFYFEQLGAIDSDRIQCVSPVCIFRFDPDDGTDGVGGGTAATVWIRNCSDPAATNDNQCSRIHNVALTGLVGADGTQLRSLSVRTGFYYVEVVGDGDNGANPHVSITGEGR